MKVRALDERPKLDEENLWLVEAYQLLSRSRQVGGFGEYYIPMTEYEAYCRLLGIHSVNQRLFLVKVISHVDAVLLHEQYEEDKKKTAK